MIAELSNDYREGKRVHTDKPEIKLDQWTEAAHWLSDAQYFNYTEEGVTKEFYIKSSKIDNDFTFDIENVEELRNYNFKSFDQYKNKRHGLFWTVKLQKLDWMNSLCDCPNFRKKYVCKHLIGIALREKLCKLPRKAITVPLAKKPQKGRKPRATEALKN